VRQIGYFQELVWFL